jgi:CO/xanthine dehydrogenase FAD-binding subunit
MYPARFEYFAPTTVEEAVSILERYGDEAKVLAGGQSLIPLMKLRFASPRALVDINRIAGLDEHYEDNDLLNVGALVRHKDCERSELLRKSYDVLADAAPQISDPVVRNLGTVAGSLAHADPQGDWGSALLAAGASVQAQGPGGSARFRSTTCSRARSPQRSSRPRSSPGCRSRSRRRRAGVPTSSWSAKSVTSRRQPSASTSPSRTGTSSRPASH